MAIASLPLNPNGPTAVAADLRNLTTSAAISKIPLQNVRFEVIPPSADTASRLEVLSCYYELKTGPNPSQFFSNGLQPDEILSWQVPFANASYSHGQINLTHDASKGIRVKIIWPFYQNRVMIAHFDSTFTVRGIISSSLIFDLHAQVPSLLELIRMHAPHAPTMVCHLLISLSLHSSPRLPSSRRLPSLCHCHAGDRYT